MELSDCIIACEIIFDLKRMVNTGDRLSKRTFKITLCRTSYID